jgi:hypothetical protein
MTGLETYLIGAAIGVGVKFIADLGVRLSKRTENTTDDMIANAFKSAVSGVSIMGLFKKK